MIYIDTLASSSSLIVSPFFFLFPAHQLACTHSLTLKTCEDKNCRHPNAFKIVGALCIFISPKMFSASLLEGFLLQQRVLCLYINDAATLSFLHECI